jgi:hypothetical protein
MDRSVCGTASFGAILFAHPFCQITRELLPTPAAHSCIEIANLMKDVRH